MPTDINLTPTASIIEIVPQSQGQTLEKSQTISARTWGMASECRAAVLLVHGLGAHSGWYEAFGRRLKVKRFFALAYDQVGFGNRRNQPFMFKQQWLDDIKCAYQHLQDTVGDKPIFVMGNSMGALLALRATADIKPAGLVMFAPGFDGHPETFRLSYRARAIYKALFDPDCELSLPYTSDDITSDQNVRNWLNNDPQMRFMLPARMLLELLKLTQDVKSTNKKLDCPVMMFTSGKERIINNTVADVIFERLQAPKKQKHCFQEAFHDLMFDPALDELVEMVSTWMLEITQERQSALKQL